MKIAVFGHDADHAMLVRRIDALSDLGHSVQVLSMRRGPERERAFPNVDLGRTYDGRFAQRLRQVGAATGIALRSGAAKGADLVWARNLDMLAVAARVRKAHCPAAPLVYETLDIHHLLTGGSPKAKLLRAVERHYLREGAAIVVSSPGFVREYYDRYHPNHPPTALIENTLIAERTPPRPVNAIRPDGPLTLGWVGNLRCARTFTLLEGVARHFGGTVRIAAHGQVATEVFPDFEARLARIPHFEWHGPYDAAHDLEGIYGRLDLVWAGVTHQAEANARWLLPNRLYEGGYFGVPPLAIAHTETARFLEEHDFGASVDEPLEENLIALLEAWRAGNRLGAERARTLSAPGHLFARGTEDLAAALELACGEGAR